MRTWRTFAAALLLTTSGGAVAQTDTAVPSATQGTLTATATVRGDTPGATYDRRVFTQFAEHLGNGIYGGLWVGNDRKIPNTRGFRNDVVGALDAYGEAAERTMDLADVNGHVFVNNVSLGLYAAVVRSEAYRDAKVDTTLATLPQVLGRDSEPFDLRFTGADGVEQRGAHIIQISNNPYGTTLRGRGSRPRRAPAASP